MRRVEPVRTPSWSAEQFRRASSLLTVLALGASSVELAAQTCPVNIPHLTGTWTVLPYRMPIDPIAANLLPTGKVLIVSGSENDAMNNSKGAQSYRAAVWDPAATSGTSISAYGVNYDVFCSGIAALPDGRSLIVGGTSDYGFTGENRASIADPLAGRFVQSQSMRDGRWYATATTLGDGRIMTMSGLTATGATSTTVEIYDLSNVAGWSLPTNVPFTPPLYPRLALLPNGKVFYTGQGSGGANANSWMFDPANGSWTTSAATTANRTYGSFVLLPLLPPSYLPRVMNFGGGVPGTRSTEIIDLSAGSPQWAPGPNMSAERIQMNAVILPNGKVLTEGGSLDNEIPSVAGKTADLYDAVTNTFSSASTAAYSRLYHSTALLLPDATVASTGSNPGTRGSYEPAIEIYTPPYLFDANDRLITTGRPSITAISPSSGVMTYNTLFTVSYNSTSPISSAVLVRPGSSTHAMDMDQRLVGLCGAAPQPACNPNNKALTLTTPPNGNIAPPGYYMLFLLDSAGVPSHAQFIQLTRYSTAAPKGTIDSPTNDVTIPQGGTVNFQTNSSSDKYSWVFPGGSPETSAAKNPGNVVFPTPGVYVASLTVIDSSGNSDPNPPTRTISVTPSTPDFSLSVGPSAQALTPGGFSTFTVTVNRLSGFSGTVNLSVASESGFPMGVSSGGFNPPSIVGSGSSTLTVNTTASAVPYALSLTVTGTSGTLRHTASTTLLINPAPPDGLSAQSGDTKISLSWPASTGASSYQMQRSTLSGGPYRTIACPAATNYLDTNVTNGVPYYYVVSGAFTGGPNAGGASSASPEAIATPQPSIAAPAAPTSLSAQAGNGQVALSWATSTAAASYRVKRATVSRGPYNIVASPTSTSYTDTSVAIGTTYYYVVSAINSTGESANSVEASATVSSATLFTTQTPASNKTDGVPYELGMKFQVARAGTITAIRYWKSSGDAGTHVGRIWSSTGTLLASVVFTRESASGWQQQALSTPLALQSGTIYVVSVNTPSYYPITVGGLAASTANGDIASVADGKNGVFTTTPGTFPNNSYQNSNYFRDIVFAPSATTSESKSLFTTQTPALNKTDGVPYELGMKFQVSQAGTITAIRYWKSSADSASHVGRIWSSAGTLLASVTFTGESGSGWQQQALSTALAVQSGTTYTVSVNTASYYSMTVGGLATSLVNGYIASVADGKNGVFATTSGTFPNGSYQNSNYFRDIVFAPNATASGSQSLFTTQTPGLNKTDGIPYELGMKFQVARAGTITAIRYWKSSNESATHVGRIWSSSGTLLASVTFSGESTSGWQQQSLPAPLAVAANTTYVVSVNVANYYSMTVGGLASPILTGDIASVADGNNGVFSNPFSFPINSYQRSNYFRDIVFVPSP